MSIKIQDNRRVCLCPQKTTSESLTVNMTQQIEMRATGKATELARKSLGRVTYILINEPKSPNMTNAVSLMFSLEVHGATE